MIPARGPQTKFLYCLSFQACRLEILKYRLLAAGLGKAKQVVLPCSCDLFPKDGSKKAITVHASSIRSACIDIAVRIRHSN